MSAIRSEIRNLYEDISSRILNRIENINTSVRLFGHSCATNFNRFRIDSNTNTYSSNNILNNDDVENNNNINNNIPNIIRNIDTCSPQNLSSSVCKYY